jgi:hypothetical protein
MKEIPAAACALADRLGANPQLGPAVVHLSQTGRMRQGPDASWMWFRAKQSISTVECQFDWRARIGPGGLVRVRDALIEGEGRLDAKLLGIVPLAHAGGTPEAKRGELMRYLAELPWAPDAILHNPGLRWREEAVDRLVVSIDAGEGAASVTLGLDGDGRIASTYAPDRPRAVGHAFVPTPWQGRFFDYRLHEGRWLPFRGEVGWLLHGANVVCWEGLITNWHVASAD